MNILLIGDIVGKPGKKIVQQALRGLRAEQSIDLVIANSPYFMQLQLRR